MNKFPQNIFPHPIIGLAVNRNLALRKTGHLKISASQLEKIPHSYDREPSKGLKEKSKKFSNISKFQSIVCICDINQCSLYKTLDVSMKP